MAGSLTVTTQIDDLGMVDVCPSCGGLLTGRTLGRSTPAGRAGGSSGVELRRCGSCRRLAQRPAGTVGGWTDAGLDPSLDYLFERTVQPVPPPWVVVAPQHRAALETELRAEVADGHPLFAQAVIAVARCEGCDEVVFSVETDPVRFVSVHLTWRGVPERPPWPWTEDLDLPLSRSLVGHEH